MTDADELRRLTPAQRAALRHVDALAASRGEGASASLRGTLRRSGASVEALAGALGAIRDHARVVLHFHPDRLDRNGDGVAAALLRDGLYRNQFETGLSNGSLTAFAGGERDSWEEALFGGAYHAAGVAVSERPKYGALELVRHADGPSPRFGSCYLVLRHAVSRRCSFTFGGSQSPLVREQSGTLAAMDCVLAALLDEVAREHGAFGLHDLGVAELLARLADDLPAPRPAPARQPVGRALDSFVEAQVHGAVELARDAERLVADPAFRGTAIEDQLAAIGARYGVALDWHPGFTLAVDRIPDDFRGPAMPPLARRIAGDGVLDVAGIGAAAASLRRDPESWRDRGSYAETLQHLKQLWHVLVRYGGAAGGGN